MDHLPLVVESTLVSTIDMSCSHMRTYKIPVHSTITNYRVRARAIIEHTITVCYETVDNQSSAEQSPKAQINYTSKRAHSRAAHLIRVYRWHFFAASEKCI